MSDRRKKTTGRAGPAATGDDQKGSARPKAGGEDAPAAAERLDTRHIFKGRVVDLSVDRVRLPNGNVIDLDMIRHPGASAVVPVDADGSVLLIRQYRYASGGYLLEVPAGKLDHGEPPEVCAAREVEEETGYRADRFDPLGWVWTTPGFTDEKIWLYLATGLKRTRQELGDDEVLTVERLPLEEAMEMARNGEIRDAKTVCALLRAGYALSKRPAR